MKLHALFVGIDRFASPQINWLSCARRDAVALHALFADTFGLPGCVLLDDRKATRPAIEAWFRNLVTSDPDDVVVITFSGHGSRTHELITYDADPADLASTSIPLTTLKDWFSAIPAKRLLCVLDCCFSGGMGAKVFVAEAHPRSTDSEQVLLDQISGQGRLVLTACTATQPAWETGRYRHGLMTYHLIEALKGAEQVVSAGKVQVYRLLEYVTNRVVDDAATLGKEQHPTLRGQLDGELTWPVFTPGSAYKAAFPEQCVQPISNNISSLEPHGFPQKLLAAWAQDIPSLNQLQIDAANQYGVLEGKDLVVSAPTSSGKTLIGELAALRGVLGRKRAFFLLPLKALVNDKHRHFSRLYQEFGIRVIRATGEIADDIPALMRGQYDICLLTYEKFTSLALVSSHILEQVGTIVVDEVQMLADTSRGANLEFLLTLLRMRRREGIVPQLIALSAVIGDTNGLERWLGAELLRREERPVPLDEGILLADGRFRYIDEKRTEHTIGPIIQPEIQKGSSQDWIIPLVRKLVGEGKQVIVFRQQKGEARGCAQYLAKALQLPSAVKAIQALPNTDLSLASNALRETLGGGVAFHTSNLDREERRIVEENFREPNSAIRVISATTTLAMGVNTPAEVVVVAGLMHPGNQPYSVAEYKNIVGRAGRLGLASQGTSYLLATDSLKALTHWESYVNGSPEDLRSQFLSDGADPRTLILRVLAATRNTSVKGIPSEDIIGFLEGSFGAFQQRLTASNWVWSRNDLTKALADLARHELIESSGEDSYHLTDLGRFSGEAGVQVESIIRLVEALKPLSPPQINDPTLIAATQLTTELDDLHFPMNKKSTQKEPTTWFGALARQGVPASLLNTMKRFVSEQHVGTLRAKKAAACLLYVSPQTMNQIEAMLTQHGGAFGGAAGPVRSASARTADLLPTVARVSTILHSGLDLTERTARLLVRLELGVPAGAVTIARLAGSNLTRGDYQELVKAGLNTSEAIESADDEAVLNCVGQDPKKVRILRDAGTALGAEAVAPTVPTFPEYES